MVFELLLTEAAQADLAAILHHSRTHHPATHPQFRARLDATLSELAESPLQWAVWKEPDIRRRLVTPYPYAIFYHLDDPQVIVEAVLHQHQDSTRRIPEPP